MTRPDAPTTQHIDELEALRYAAMVDADTDTLDDLLSDHLIYTHSSGSVDGKAAYLAALRSGAVVYRALEHAADATLVRPGVAVVNGTMSGSVLLHGTEKTLDNRVTAVWVTDEDRWRLAAFHATPVPG